MGKLLPIVEDAEYWICACVKRRKGTMTHIKGNHPSVLKCRKCGTTKADSDRIGMEIKERTHG